MQYPTLEHYAALVRRHLVLMIAGLVLGTIGGLVYLQSQPLTYTATSEVLLGRLYATARIDPSARDPRLVTIDTDAAVLRSRQVLRAVAVATGLQSDEALRRLTVDAEPLTEVLRVSFSDARAETAERGAEAAAETLLRVRATRLYTSRAKHTMRLERRLRRLNDEMDELRINGEPYNAPVAALKRRLEDQHSLLYEQLALGPDPGYVLTDARTPSQPARANPEVPVASGGMLGLLAGLAVGLLRDVRLRSVPGSPRSEVQRLSRRGVATGDPQHGGAEPR